MGKGNVLHGRAQPLGQKPSSAYATPADLILARKGQLAAKKGVSGSPGPAEDLDMLEDEGVNSISGTSVNLEQELRTRSGAGMGHSQILEPNVENFLNDFASYQHSLPPLRPLQQQELQRLLGEGSGNSFFPDIQTPGYQQSYHFGTAGHQEDHLDPSLANR